jgi:hypothetical protein
MFDIRGRAYVDASGDANLAAMAGADERDVPEDNERQLASLALRRRGGRRRGVVGDRHAFRRCGACRPQAAGALVDFAPIDTTAL